jgi:hypothetical protein
MQSPEASRFPKFAPAGHLPPITHYGLLTYDDALFFVTSLPHFQTYAVT